MTDNEITQRNRSASRLALATLAGACGLALVLAVSTGAEAVSGAGDALAPSASQAGTAHDGGVAQDTLGRSIFTGKGLCYACHGPDGTGTPLAPNLTDSTWLNIDGSQDSIVALIKRGVPNPKEAPAPMLPMGGAQLTEAEIQAVAAYVYSLSHPGG